MLSKTILLNIDIQNGFYENNKQNTNKGQSDYTADLARIALKATKTAIKWCRFQKIPVIWTLETHRINQVDIGKELKWEGWHTPESSEESELHHEMKNVIESKDIIISNKRRWDAFYQTDLDLVLHHYKAEQILMTGSYAATCIISTALAAKMRDLDVTIVQDAILGSDRGILAMEHVCGKFCQFIKSSTLGELLNI